MVVPFLDERENLPRLVDELRAVIAELGRPVEVLLVDDGSTDGSAEVVERHIDGDGRFRVVRLRRNYGKSAAMAAGRDASRGRILITMDADLQDPPEAIPRFLEAIDAGHDVVAGWRQGRAGPWHRRLLSDVFNWLITRVTGVRIHDVNSGFKAYRREALEAIHLSPGMHRYTAILAHGYGFRVTEVVARHRDRFAGHTKFGLWRYVEALIGFVLALSLCRGLRAPLTALGRTALLLIALALALVLLWAVGILPSGHGGGPGWVAFGAWTFGLLGVQLLVLRLALEWSAQSRRNGGRTSPLYRVVEERRGSDAR